MQFIGFTPEQEVRTMAWFCHAHGVAATMLLSIPKIPVAFVLYDSPHDLAEALGTPEYVDGGQVVARTNIGTGVIYLSKPLIAATVFYECGRYFFHDMSGMETGSQAMEKFAADCEEAGNRTAEG